MNKEDQDKIFTYLITSAKGCVEEPPLYGPFRLLEAFSILLNILSPEDVDEFYYKLEEQIKMFQEQCMNDEKLFIKGLNGAVDSLSDYIINK